MTTKFIGLKDFRQNLASYTKEAKLKSVRLIILKKNVPILEVKSLDEKEFTLEKLVDGIAMAREDVKKGRVYTEEQVYKMFGL
jgi:hypothetical protein